jgi:predicted small metal-binding protein
LVAESAKKEFRCADVGYTECGWKLEGNSDEEMVPVIEDHAAKVHRLELKEEAVQHVREAIRDVA